MTYQDLHNGSFEQGMNLLTARGLRPRSTDLLWSVQEPLTRCRHRSPRSAPHNHRRHITHPAFSCVIKPSRSGGPCGASARRIGRVSRRDTRPDTGGIRCPLVHCVAPTSVEDAVGHTIAPTCRSEEPALG